MSLNHFLREEYDDKVYAVGYAPSSKLWDSGHNPNKKVSPVDQFEEYTGLAYHLVPKTDSSGVVAGRGVYDCSKLAPAIKKPSKGFFNDSCGVKMQLTRGQYSTTAVQPVCLFEHASMYRVPHPIACTLAKNKWSQLLRREIILGGHHFRSTIFFILLLSFTERFCNSNNNRIAQHNHNSGQRTITTKQHIHQTLQPFNSTSRPWALRHYDHRF